MPRTRVSDDALRAQRQAVYLICGKIAHEPVALGNPSKARYVDASVAFIEDVYEAQGGRCYSCGAPRPLDLLKPVHVAV